MLKLHRLLLIFTDPKRFISGMYRYLDWLIIDKIFFLISFTVFSLFPRYLYLIYGKPFPLFTKKERWIKKKNPEDEWIYKNKKIIFKEINIICRGNYKKYLKKINKKIPTFFVSFDHDPKINIPYMGIIGGGAKKKFNSWQIERFKNKLYPINIWRSGSLSKNNEVIWQEKREPYPNKKYLKKINVYLPKRLKDTYKVYSKKKIKFNKKNYKISKILNEKALVHFRDFNYSKNIGTALGAIFFLGIISKKVNVYGWDYYLKKNVDEYSYWELIKTISKSSKGKGYEAGTFWDVDLRGPWGERSKVHFSQGILNMHYASRLIGLKKYKIFSKLNKIYKQKRLLKNIEKVFFDTL